jgi:hypothetical protein
LSDARLSVGIKARFPGFIEPALATSIEKPPKGARWIHEIKFDGYPRGRSNNWVKVTCAQRETLRIADFALKDKHFDGIYVGRREGYMPESGQRVHARRCNGIARAIKTADPQDTALRKADSSSRHLGRADVAGENRIPSQIRRRQTVPIMKCVDAIREARRILGEYIEPGRPRDAAASIERIVTILDNDVVCGALKRIEGRNHFELVEIE